MTMMASHRNLYFDNVIGYEDIDIDMEVKSEQDSEEDSFIDKECGSDSQFDDEFIIPEQRMPDETVVDGPSNLLVDSIINSHLSHHSSNGDECTPDIDNSQHNINDCDIDEDVEDEPEVEIDEVTVPQEVVEVALDPSLLLFVNKDKKVLDQNKLENQDKLKQQSEENASAASKNASSDHPPLKMENSFIGSQILFTSLCDKEETVLRSFGVISTNTRQQSNSVTAALRKVKRKPYREPLEPLNEIECSSDNIINSKNIDCNELGPDKQSNRCNIDEKQEEDDDCNKIFFDAPSPCDSDSDFKEQKQITVMRKRKVHPRLKSSNFRGCKRTRKKKVRRKQNSRKANHNHNKIKQFPTIQYVKGSKETVNRGQKQSTNNTIEIDCKDEKDTDNDKPKDENFKKVKKLKKDRNRRSIFEEIKMDYTVLNENDSKEKPKRIRKRDKKSREIAAFNKPESFDCTVCGRKFKEKSHLATHARAHIDVRNYKCNKCGSLFKTKTNLFFHMKTHSDIPFTCEKCNKTYPERRTLMRHIRVVHSSQNIYPCDQCGREFKSAINLNLHYTLHTGSKPFTCKICGKSFVYKSTYIAHMKGHDADNSFNCELCPKTCNNKADVRRQCNHHSEARPWLCTVCGKGYPLKGTLKNHMKTHEPEKPFKCTECPKSFMKKQSFECHVKMHAGESPQFMCDQCSQSYFNVFALKRHYLKHTSERKFVCEVCQKAFWMKDALKVHMRTHSNIKMFPCLQCPKAFAHKHTLDAHVRIHLDVQPYSCSVCQKTFIHKYNLARHERQHLSATSVPVLHPTIVPPVPQTLPISVMMLPPMPTATSSTVLHNYSINAVCL